MDVLYVAMQLKTWDNALEVVHFPLDVKIQTNLAGFLPVYKTIGDLRADYPDAEFFAIAAQES